MDIYNYDPQTFEYTGTSKAHRNPRGEGEFILSAFSTDSAPPKNIPEGQRAVFRENQWEIVVDNRGQAYWLDDGTHVVIETLGETVPEDALSEEPDLRTLEERKRDAKQQVFAFIASVKAKLTEGYSTMEVDAWATKALEARALLAGGGITQAPILLAEAGSEAAARTFAQRVATKAQVYERIIGLISRMRSETQAALEAADTPEAIQEVLSQAQTAALAELSNMGITLPESGGV